MIELNLIIEGDLYELQVELKKEKINVRIDDFTYEFLSRIEHLAVPSCIIYPGESLPEKFGVRRGYAGGDMHSRLMRSEVHRMDRRRIPKAERLLKIFEKYFWQILNDIDDAQKIILHRELEEWEKATI